MANITTPYWGMYKKIASKVGCSYSTVSKVLVGNTDKFSPELINNIKQTAAELIEEDIKTKEAAIEKQRQAIKSLAN